jgi:hypothetical protein
VGRGIILPDDLIEGLVCQQRGRRDGIGDSNSPSFFALVVEEDSVCDL